MQTIKALIARLRNEGLKLFIKITLVRVGIMLIRHRVVEDLKEAGYKPSTKDPFDWVKVKGITEDSLHTDKQVSTASMVREPDAIRILLDTVLLKIYPPRKYNP